jgi:hypothetical protein
MLYMPTHFNRIFKQDAKLVSRLLRDPRKKKLSVCARTWQIMPREREREISFLRSQHKVRSECMFVNLTGTKIRGCRGASSHSSHLQLELQAAVQHHEPAVPEMLSVVGGAGPNV